MKIKKKLHIVIFAAFTAFILVGIALKCEHEEFYTSVVKEATCTDAGQADIVCQDCGDVIKSEPIDPLGHSFGDYVLIEEPGINKNGLELAICSVCHAEGKREYVCPHEVTEALTVKKPSCTQEGIKSIVCKGCRTTLEKKFIEKLDCEFGDWIYTEYATPTEPGERYRECFGCGDIETESYTITMAGENSIYIPGTGINHVVAKSYFTQAAVDKHDIVYTEHAKNAGSNNPFVLGHSTRTLGNLPKTEVGQYIYLSIDGVVETYEVVVSEYALENESETAVIGRVTYTNMWKNYGCKTLHMYTCHGGGKGRWLVLAKIVPDNSDEKAADG